MKFFQFINFDGLSYDDIKDMLLKSDVNSRKRCYFNKDTLKKPFNPLRKIQKDSNSN